MDAHNAAHWKERVAKEHHSAHAAHALPHANPTNLLSHMKTRTLVAEPNNTPTPYWSKARASTAWEQYQTGYNPISGYPIRWKSAKPGSFQPTGIINKFNTYFYLPYWKTFGTFFFLSS